MKKSLLQIVICIALAIRAHAAIAFVSSVAPAGTLSAASVTTGTFNTTGANLIVVSVTYSLSTPPTITDSAGNGTPTALTAQFNSTFNRSSQQFYWLNPTTSSSHTVTCANASIPCTITAEAFSGVLAFDKSTGENTGTGTPGSLTPTNANSLLLSAMAAVPGGGTDSISGGGFSAVDQTLESVFPGISVAYAIQSGGPSASNPTWTAGTGNTLEASTLAAFSPKVASANTLTLLGAGPEQ